MRDKVLFAYVGSTSWLQLLIIQETLYCIGIREYFRLKINRKQHLSKVKLPHFEFSYFKKNFVTWISMLRYRSYSFTSFIRPWIIRLLYYILTIHDQYKIVYKSLKSPRKFPPWLFCHPRRKQRPCHHICKHDFFLQIPDCRLFVLVPCLCGNLSTVTRLEETISTISKLFLDFNNFLIFAWTEKSSILLER